MRQPGKKDPKDLVKDIMEMARYVLFLSSFVSHKSFTTDAVVRLKKAFLRMQMHE
jgi:hypothetical protein